MITPALIAMIMNGKHGLTYICPSYSTVTLKFLTGTYTPPLGSAATLQLLPCPYIPPTVI